MNVPIKMPTLHEKQEAFVYSEKKRIMIKAARRSGKTSGVGVRACERFLSGKRVKYVAPQGGQASRFATVVEKILRPGIEAGVLKSKGGGKNIRFAPGYGNDNALISASSGYNPDAIRSDWADELIFDEWQLQHPQIWTSVGAPMLIDRGGTAVFIFTPPNPFSTRDKKRDIWHAQAHWNNSQKDNRYEHHMFYLDDNPWLSKGAYEDMTADMTELERQIELDLIDITEMPDAMWKSKHIKVGKAPELYEFEEIVIGLDPSGTRRGDECGIVVTGILPQRDKRKPYWVLADLSGHYSPLEWRDLVLAAYDEWHASAIIAETNYGGDMVEALFQEAFLDRKYKFNSVKASKGKAQRMEPVVAMYERGEVRHAKEFTQLKTQMCMWNHMSSISPDRIDALVWGLTHLMRPYRNRTIEVY